MIDADKLSREVSDTVFREVEKRVREWIEFARGVDWTNLLDRTLRDNERLREQVAGLSSEVHSLKTTLDSRSLMAARYRAALKEYVFCRHAGCVAECGHIAQEALADA